MATECFLEAPLFSNPELSNMRRFSALLIYTHMWDASRGAGVPAVYTCLTEELLSNAVDKLAALSRPSGIPLPPHEREEESAEVSSARSSRAYRPSHVVYSNFADDTYLFGTSLQDISYPTCRAVVEFRKLDRS